MGDSTYVSITYKTSTPLGERGQGNLFGAKHPCTIGSDIIRILIRL